MKTTKALAIFAAGVLTLGSAAGLAGCKPSQPQGDLGRATTLYVQLINYTNTADAAYERLATVYNETQGKEDDIEVIIDEQTSVNNYTSQLRPDKTNQYDIMTIDNMTFKEVLVEYFDGANVIVPLDEYLDDPEFAQALGLSDIPETSMDMWKMTQSSDEDGFFWYVGRTDDVIKSSGYRIGPFEIESVLMELPQVLECGVTGVPDPVRGMVVKATIVLAKGYTPSDALAKEIQTLASAEEKLQKMIEGERVFIIELSARPSGHHLHDLFTPMATGVDMAETYIRSQCGLPYRYEPEETRRLLIRYFALPEGIVRHVPAKEELPLPQDVALRAWDCEIRPGDRLGQVINGHSVMGRGYFILEGSTDERLEAAADGILGKFDVNERLEG